MRIKPNGNVGIGTYDPLAHAKLHVAGGLFVGEGINLDDGTTGGVIEFASRDSVSYTSDYYSAACIGTRVHHWTAGGGGNTDKMEMVFYIGNNADSYGPDRFTFIGANFNVHTFNSNTNPGVGNFGKAAVDGIGSAYEDETPQFMVDEDGKVGINTIPNSTLHIKQLDDTNDINGAQTRGHESYGLTIERADNTNNWSFMINHSNYNDLNILYNGTRKGYLNDSVNSGHIDFTGQPL